MSQLALNVLQRLVYSEENFILHQGVKDTFEACTRLLVQSNFSISIISGETGCGKTHLLVALCAKAVEHGARTVSVEGAEFVKWAGEWLASSLEGRKELIVIDDFDLILKFNSEALSGAFVAVAERAKANAAHVVITTTYPLEPMCADEHIGSRIRSAHHFAIKAPADEELAAVIKALALQRGMLLSPEKIRYIARRVCRSVPAIRNYVEALEQYSREEGTKVTLPLAADLLAKLRD